MISFPHRRSPRLALLILSLSLSGAAVAQSPLVYPSPSPLGEARAAEARNDPAEALARYLRVLASNPRSLEALTGAGRAALDIEDPNAAVGFYGRAEEIAPRDGRVKAGLASALVQLEQPAEALRLFQAAVALGVSESIVAGDRGLAYDLRGDNRRAQADYQLSLRARYDPDVARRLAISQAISGDRAAALQTLDPLLRQQNKAAWRTRAFVHALTGDAAGAAQLADSLMPPVQAAQMKPFLGRLAGLAPSAKAMAVHFGHFPSNGYGSVAMAQALPLPGAAQRPMPSVPGASAPSFTSRPAANAAPRRLSWREQREQRELARAREAEQQRVTVARSAEQRRLAQEAEQRRLVDARLAEERRLTQLRQVEQQRLAEQQRFAEQRRLAEEQRLAEQRRVAEQQRLAEQRRIAEAQEAARSAAAARVLAANPSLPSVPQAWPQVPAPTQMAALGPASSGSAPASTGAPQAATLPFGGSPSSLAAAPAAPEPAFASLANMSPQPGFSANSTTAVPQASAMALGQAPAGQVPVPSPGIRAIELPASAVAPGVAPAQTPVGAGGPMQLASAEPVAAARIVPRAAPANGGAGDVLQVEPRPAPQPVAAAAPAGGSPAAQKPQLPKLAQSQVKLGATDVPAGSSKARSIKDKVATTDPKAGSKVTAGAKLEKVSLTKKDERDVKGAKSADKDGKAGKLAAKDAEETKAGKGKVKEPARVWVQVAGGADKKALPRDWSRLRAKYGNLLEGQSAWTTPLRATNRLLVGPFKSFDASQEFVNKAGKAGLSSFTFTSDEGQAIEKLAGK